MGYPSASHCIRIVLYAWSSYFPLFWILQNYLNEKWPLNGHFEIDCSPKLIMSFADITVPICQIKRRYAGSFFLKRTNEYFFVGGPI